MGSKLRKAKAELPEQIHQQKRIPIWFQHVDLIFPLSWTEIPTHRKKNILKAKFFYLLPNHVNPTWKTGGFGTLLGHEEKVGASRICKFWNNKKKCKCSSSLGHKKRFFRGEKKETFMFKGRALNLGIFASISSSSSAELFILTVRIRWAVSSLGSFGLVKVSLVLLCMNEVTLSWIIL